MSTPKSLDANALAAELAKLPHLSAPTPAQLSQLHLALASAIASGQSADELAAALTSETPSILSNVQPHLQALTTTGQAPATPAQPADWIARTVPLALARSTVTRVAVLDREPTALGGLELPDWARALKPSTFIGPVHTGLAATATGPSKFITTFSSTETYTFVRGAVTLCVLPVTTIRFDIFRVVERIEAGSVWIAVDPIDSTAPANTFAGFTMQSGSYTCDQTLSFASTTVEVPATATLSFTFVPTAEPAPSTGLPLSLTSPGQISVTFPPTGPATLAFDTCAANVYGMDYACTASGSAAVYNSVLKVLYIAGTCTPSNFAPEPGTGTLLALSGSAPIVSGGWAIPASVSTTPSTLGTASDAGYFAFAFGPGVSSLWTGITRPEQAAGGFLLAGPSGIFVEIFSGSAAGVVVEQQFPLWNDQDATTNPANPRPCMLILTRIAGQSLIYALAAAGESLSLSGKLTAFVDRPVTATGARLFANFADAIVLLTKNSYASHLYAVSTTPALLGVLVSNFPMALDNAILTVIGPSAILISAVTDAEFKALHGYCTLLFSYLLRELFLPDPYTGALTSGNNDATIDNNLLEGVLASIVTWTSPTNVSLRIADTGHAHPTAPPTTEASSPPYLVIGSPIGAPPVHLPAPSAIDKALVAQQPAQAPPQAKEIATSRSVAPPSPAPLPSTPPGAVLLDLSTRASQLGVSVEFPGRVDASGTPYTIDGLSVRGPASLLALTTLPAIAWEPMYDRSTASDPGVNHDTLLHPPNDGPLTQIASTSATLIPISPLQSLRAVLDAGPGGFTAQLTMPFGMVAVLEEQTANGSVLPSLVLTQPTFPPATPSGAPYTGAWQVSLLAPDPTQPDPVLAGITYLRTQTDNPDAPALSYGEQVLGTDVAKIFSSRFDPPAGSDYGTGVPLRRYDLTGYGASTLSEWTNTTPKETDVIKAFFHVLVGRTSQEVIQVQSVIHPHKIRAVRTVKIDRRGSGVVERYDSNWQPASDGFYLYTADEGVSPEQIHTGMVGGLINIRNIQQLGLPFQTTGTQDGTDQSPGGPVRQKIAIQAVTFDADVVIPPSHSVIKGGQKSTDLNGVSHNCVPATGITGYMGLQYDFHLSLNDMVESPIRDGCGGPINATINVGGANSVFRATGFSVIAVRDGDTAGKPEGLAGVVAGFPTLSSDGSWSVAVLHNGKPAPVALDPTQAVPLVQPNVAGGSTPGSLIHFADPSDIFRLDPGSPTPPQTFYGLLQGTGTQSNFLSRPILTVGSQQLTLGDTLNVAHAGALLGAISHFPGITQCLQFPASALQPLTNTLDSASLATTQNLSLANSINATDVPYVIPLISTSVANVTLQFQWSDPQNDNSDPDVVISLGQPTSPSWSLDVNHIAIALQVPALGSTPIMWLEGAFHADADTIPAFPNLNVVFDGALQFLTGFFTVLEDIASVISPGGGGSAGLNVHFADGKLTVTDNFTLPAIPLGPGTIDNVSLDIGSTIDIVALDIDFLVGIGSPDTPCHWIVDPLAGTVCIQAGVVDNQLDILIQGGIGLGLALDLGIASGSASITIAVQIQIQGTVITLMLLLTGQAQVDVLGGLASAGISLTAGLGFSIDDANFSIDVIGTAQVGIHISICWVVNISWSGSWTFEKQLPLVKSLVGSI